MTGSIESFAEGSDRRNSFTLALASILGIPDRQIYYISVRSGSVIVEIAFMKIASSGVAPDRAVLLLKEVFLAGKLDIFGVIDLTIGGRSVLAAPAAPILAIAASSGLIFVIGVLLLRYFRSRLKCVSCGIKVSPVDDDVLNVPQSQAEYSKSAAYQSLHFLAHKESTITATVAECSSPPPEAFCFASFSSNHNVSLKQIDNIFFLIDDDVLNVPQSQAEYSKSAAYHSLHFLAHKESTATTTVSECSSPPPEAALSSNHCVRLSKIDDVFFSIDREW